MLHAGKKENAARGHRRRHQVTTNATNTTKHSANRIALPMCTAELLYVGRSTARTQAATADRLHPTIADTMTDITFVRIHPTRAACGG